LVVAFGSLLVVALAAATAPAQPAASRSTAAPSVDVVLIDIGAVFKEHPYFSARMKELQADVEAAEAQIKKERDQLRNMMDELGRIKAGTQEYKDFETQVFEFRSKLDTKVQLQRKEFLQREAKIYHQAYQEVQREVEAFAAANNISIVLKFNREAPDPEKPEEIIRDLNKPVLYYAKYLDITPHIVKQLREKMPAPTADQRGGPVQFPRR
jgi:Skp family chaperone for outer membrane proteins